MLIAPPQNVERHGRPALSAAVQVEGDSGLPATLDYWVRHGSLVPDAQRADAFVVALLPLAMRLGEPVVVQGPVSTALAYGLRSVQHALATWWPALFRRVEVRYEQLDADPAPGPRPPGVGCCFSGGVDSWYTVLSHLAGSEPLAPYRISHALITHSFSQLDDTQPDDDRAERLHAVYAPLLAARGVELMLVESNLRRFRDRILRDGGRMKSYASSLLSWAHALGRHFGRFHLAGHSTWAYRDMTTFGSHLALDHHFGSDRLQVLHFGAGATRSERIEYIAGAPDALRSLRVCLAQSGLTAEPGQIMNCGRCKKCMRTLMVLDMLGQREACTTFPADVDLRAMQRASVLAADYESFLIDNLALARRTGRSDWEKPLAKALRMRLRRAARRERRVIRAEAAASPPATQ